MRIVVVNAHADEAVTALRDARPDVDWQAVLDPEHVAEGRADAVFGSNLPAMVFQRLCGVRWVQWWSAGIDKAYTVPRDMMLSRLVGIFTQDMIEYVLACLLDWVKQLPTARAAQQNHRWGPYLVNRLAGKRIGVAGMGAIGAGIGKALADLGVEVDQLAHHRRPASYAHQVYGPDQVETFLGHLEGLVLVLPLTPATVGFLNAERIACLPRGSVLVNVGRGGLVHEPALLAALDTGWIDRAYLDVVAQEPLPASSPLWGHPRVTITPHIAGPSRISDVVHFSLANLVRFERGEPLAGIVDRSRGY